VVDDPGTQYYRVDCPDAVLAEALKWALTQIGKPYDWTAIYGMAFRRDWHEDSKWFCSEFVEGAFDAAGYPLVVNNGRVDLRPGVRGSGDGMKRLMGLTALFDVLQ
jgi:uncharacterized protein YycO